MQVVVERTSPGSCVAVLCGVACVVAAMGFDWLHAGVGVETAAYSSAEVAVLAVPIALAASVALAAAIAALVTGNPGWMRAAAVAGLAVALLTAPVIMLGESIAAALPDDVLPRSLRRLTVGFGAGHGVWLALAGGVTILVAGRGWRAPYVTSFALARGARAARVVPAVVLVVATAAFVWLRYEPWVASPTPGSTRVVSGWSLPWAGPLSLAAGLLLGASVAAAAALRLALAGLLAAAGGWMATFAAAIVAQAAAVLSTPALEAAEPSWLRDFSPRVELEPATWLAFTSGLAAAAAGAGLLHLAARRHQETP